MSPSLLEYFLFCLNFQLHQLPLNHLHKFLILLLMLQGASLIKILNKVWLRTVPWGRPTPLFTSTTSQRKDCPFSPNALTACFLLLTKSITQSIVFVLIPIVSSLICIHLWHTLSNAIAKSHKIMSTGKSLSISLVTYSYALIRLVWTDLAEQKPCWHRDNSLFQVRCWMTEELTMLLCILPTANSILIGIMKREITNATPQTQKKERQKEKRKTVFPNMCQLGNCVSSRLFICGIIP